ncbi:hypothetical protein [Streptomyces sp. NBC_01637]|uniref:hypothetical protein n=1 Tax=unclassified Streptomyces TaxID=2593676 RepID=UPI00386A7429|nr:hypothetical protein OH719_14080 [Streptomyces sp. NBC_01653]WTD91983.1 hypothetical protein OG891_32790 [Streptomyces sp. NBC_01637]
MAGVRAGGAGTGAGSGRLLRARQVHRDASRDARSRDVVDERESHPYTCGFRRAFADALRDPVRLRCGRRPRAVDEEARTAEIPGHAAPARQRRAERKARRCGPAEPEPRADPAARSAASDADPRVERRGPAAR